ncbi:MAG: LysR family transcriptional regulator [Verrucomicrobiota bacterium]
MNVHHLELFYYVARYGGISEAARKMPYGIQQPAVSGQILQLEDSLGVTLFQRRPFALTAAGRELYEFAGPFFSRLSEVAEKVGGGSSSLVRMSASSLVLKEYLPQLLRNVKAKFPNLKLSLQSGFQADVVGALEKQEVDVVVTSLEGKRPVGITCQELLRLPLSLLVEKGNSVKSAAELFARDRIDHALISLPASEAITRLFQEGLLKRKISWPVSIEVSSLDLIETYVAAGFGVGLTLDIPGQKWGKGVKALPLDDFPPLVLAILWKGKLGEPQQCVVDECVAKAREIGA